jgi:hypothetical protein
MANRLRIVISVFLAVMVFGCAQSKEQIGEIVKASMQEKFNSDPQFKDYHFTVTSVQVLSKGGNQYQGLAKITYESTSYDTPVEITVDGAKVMWQAPPGAFGFVAQKELQKLQNEVTKVQQVFQQAGEGLQKGEEWQVVEEGGIPVQQGDYQKEANEAKAKYNLRVLSTACETYATANSGNYPSNVSSLLGGDIPYLKVNVCDTVTDGYAYSCIFSLDGYTITASLGQSGAMGGRGYTMTTGGVLNQVD